MTSARRARLSSRGTLKTQLEELAADLPIAGGALRVTLDDDDPDGQTLLLQYPAVSDRGSLCPPGGEDRGGRKIGAGPAHAARRFGPTSPTMLAGFDLAVPNVTTVDPVRTFWDKVLILHSLRRSFEDRGVLRGGGQRSRGTITTWTGCCARRQANGPQATWRWPRTAGGMSACSSNAPARTRRCRAASPSCRRRPCSISSARDYEAMAVMIFGEVPAFDDRDGEHRGPGSDGEPMSQVSSDAVGEGRGGDTVWQPDGR